MARKKKAAAVVVIASTKEGIKLAIEALDDQREPEQPAAKPPSPLRLVKGPKGAA
jgi:hypothetical protein